MKWLYHKEHGAKLFKPEENPAGWVDSPAKIDEAVSGNEIIEDLKIPEEKKPKKKSKE